MQHGAMCRQNAGLMDFLFRFGAELIDLTGLFYLLKLLRRTALILYSPVELQAKFGELEGQWSDFWYLVTRQTEEQLVVLVSAQCENLIANATVTVEFDGFIKIELRLLPFWSYSKNQQSVARLTGLSLRVHVTAESSSLFHYWPNDKTSIIPAADIINAGQTKTESFPFKPYVWTGWEWGGLGIFCGESEQGFELNDPDQCVCISKTKEYTTLELRIFRSYAQGLAKKEKGFMGQNTKTSLLYLWISGHAGKGNAKTAAGFL